MTTLSPLLVDAKKEYTLQLADLMAPYVMNTIARMYESVNRRDKEFKEALRQVPNWNHSTIEERTNDIHRRNPQLDDLIAACCVSYTKVLGSIRLNQNQNSNVRVSLPQSTAFVHSVYTHVAKEFFYESKLVYADRHAKMEVMRNAIEESVRQHVPIQQLLKAYLSVAVDDNGMDPIAAATDLQEVARDPMTDYTAGQMMFPSPMMHDQQHVLPPMMQEPLQPPPHAVMSPMMQPPQMQMQQQQPAVMSPMMHEPLQPQMQQPPPPQPAAVLSPMMQEPPPQANVHQHPVEFFEGAGDFD